MSDTQENKDMTNSNEATNKSNEDNNNTENTVNTNKNVDNDADINKLISDIEKDMELKKEQLFTETKAKFDKEYGAKFSDKDNQIKELKEKIGSLEETYKETTKQVIDDYKNEMKSKFDAIEKEISTRQSSVPSQDNPFRQKEEKMEGDWYKRKDMSDEEKYKLFVKYTLGK